MFYQGISLLSLDVLVALCDQPLPSGNNARCQPELTGQSVLTNIQYGERILIDISNIMEIWTYGYIWIHGYMGISNLVGGNSKL